jgi:hypothetical protein
MWLLCHGVSNDEVPLTVKDVHVSHSQELQELLEEMMPRLKALGNEHWITTNDSFQSAWSVPEMLNYLETYSMSISGGAITPSRDLALSEIRERNGLLLIFNG